MADGGSGPKPRLLDQLHGKTRLFNCPIGTEAGVAITKLFTQGARYASLEEVERALLLA